ncbi:MAG: hypothetical protein GY774_02705 [Planctomycetes bacterium]|nr:hypothetical protein [Planctomycetota bacterium]
MFKVRQGSIATERDGVREDLFHKYFADYFLSAGRIDQKCKVIFEVNYPVKINVMNLFFSMKGE